MFRLLPVFYIAICSLSIPGMKAQNFLAEEYCWKHPAPDTVLGAADLIEILREEIDKILYAGPLAPIRLAFGDLHWEHYFLYQEPGRILTTLGWAWPYMTQDQKERTLHYVDAELSSARRSPWSPHFTVPRDEGTRREWYPSAHLYGINDFFGDFRPRLHTLYGFWLFCYRSGQMDHLRDYYADIVHFYQNHHRRAKLYGDMNGHIAMARIAAYNGDEPQMEFALRRLQEELSDGLHVEHKHTFAKEGFNGWDAPYNRQPGTEMYHPRKDGWLYRGFIFLNMGPEISRFLKDSCFTQIDSMHREGKRLFPMWWLMQAPYYPRWTGDESIGLPSEVFGMFHPVETWILNTEPAKLRKYLRSSPTGIGDCYWLESLVQTIESHSKSIHWIDVRSVEFPQVVIEETVSVAEWEKKDLPMSLIPNPNTGSVQLILAPNVGETEITILNTQGKLVYHQSAFEGVMLTIDTGVWPPGTYHLTVWFKKFGLFKSVKLVRS